MSEDPWAPAGPRPCNGQDWDDMMQEGAGRMARKPKAKAPKKAPEAQVEEEVTPVQDLEDLKKNLQTQMAFCTTLPQEQQVFIAECRGRLKEVICAYGQSGFIAASLVFNEMAAASGLAKADAEALAEEATKPKDE